MLSVELEFKYDADYEEIWRTIIITTGLSFAITIINQSNTPSHPDCIFSTFVKTCELLVDTALASIDMQANAIYNKFANTAHSSK